MRIPIEFPRIPIGLWQVRIGTARLAGRIGTARLAAQIGAARLAGRRIKTNGETYDHRGRDEQIQLVTIQNLHGYDISPVFFFIACTQLLVQTFIVVHFACSFTSSILPADMEWRSGGGGRQLL